MERITRRRALQLGGLGVASAVAGAVGLSRGLTGGGPPVRPTVGAAFTQPPVLSSENGQLNVRLVAAKGRVALGGRQASVLSYNGGVPGPTLRLKAGDRLRVALTNQLPDATNLHVHGLHVSPSGTGDNIFVSIDPGNRFDYEYQLPSDHPAGVFWYHPHLHGSVADQVFGGLYGAIVVEDAATGAQAIPVTRERVLVISDISLDGGGTVAPVSARAKMMGREGDVILVNGQLQPRLQARPGERERWRIVNACAARYLRLRLDGHQLQLLGIDSGRLATPREVSDIFLAAGNRADVLVTVGSASGQLRTLPVSRGGAMGATAGGSVPSGGQLATVDVVGGAVPALPTVPALAAPPRDLRSTPVQRRRTLTFAMGMGGGGMGGGGMGGGGMGGGGMGGGGMRFTIDGLTFDAARDDQSVQLGTVEEWTLSNPSPMDHPVHLHVWPMQIVEQGGQAVQPVSWQDVINVPAGGNVKVLIAFDDFGGRTVYHCHILDHEDQGMMGTVNAR